MGYPVNMRRVFIENAFWARLIDQQAVAYLNLLVDKSQPGILLVWAPEVRRHTLWDEPQRRLKEPELAYEQPSDQAF